MSSAQAPEHAAPADTFEASGEAALAREIDTIDLDAQAILSSNDRVIERHFVKEWGGHVYLQTITGTDRDEFEADLTRSGKMSTENIRAKLLQRCLCDKDGTKLFTLDQIAALGLKAAAPLTVLYNRASELNAVSNEDVDDLAKNSGRGATATS